MISILFWFVEIGLPGYENRGVCFTNLKMFIGSALAISPRSLKNRLLSFPGERYNVRAETSHLPFFPNLAIALIRQ